MLTVPAGEFSGLSFEDWSIVYNALSFGIAAMGSATIFFWLMIHNVAKPFKPALAITGIVTFIATYHYFRIFNSWCDGSPKQRNLCSAEVLQINLKSL